MSLSERGYDAIVVGAGPAGAVCAARLCASGRSTLLLEAGPSGDHSPARHGLVPPDGKNPWYWPPVDEWIGNPSDVLGASSTNYATDYWSGRGIGGGSAVNGMVLSPGSAADYDRWAEHHGCIGWGGQDMKPWLDKAIDVLQPEPAVVGDGDPGTTAVVLAFDGAVGADGLGQIGNGGSTLDPDARGVLVPMLSTRQGRRRTVPAAYLADRESENLTIGDSTRVDRVLLSRGRAKGVVLPDGRAISAPLVVAAAGALGSARLLHRSGLRDGVGTRAKNHPSVAATFDWPHLDNVSGDAPSAPAVLRVLRWEVDSGSTGKGVGVRTGGRVAEIHLVGPFGAGSNATGALLGILQEPSSVGCLEDASSDRPRLLTNRLGDLSDRTAFRSVLRTLGELSTRLTSILASKPASVGAADPLTVVELAGLDEHRLDRWMVTNQGPVYHAVATCRMGSKAEDGSCTESSPESAGAVRGVAGVVVADASIFPDLVCGGLQLAVTAVAERVSAGLVSATGP